ncbi:MAG TPA: TolC family protein, partial [Novosphingobium sp.]|nr:TolC family protein [Novosphingobium sp.]
QSVERLNLARGVLHTAEVNLATSREKYVQLVGSPPDQLTQPPPLANLPAGADDAVEAAMQTNPDLLSAQESAKAAGFDAKVAGSARLPKIAVVGTYEYDNYFNTYGQLYAPYYYQFDKISQVTVQASFPLFQGGQPAAEQRKARATQSAALEHANSVERQVVQATHASFIAWRASDNIIEANHRAVEAAQQSLDGVRAENKIGDRTILDVLNAEQELLNAQVQLVAARHDAYVAAFNLLAAMGRVTPRDLGFDESQIYDPAANYRRVRGSIWDWGKGPKPVAVSSGTAAVTMQNGDVK